LIAPPFVKDNTTDFADAEATCEAASRPLMHCVTVKTPEQQTLLALHRMRETLVRVYRLGLSGHGFATQAASFMVAA
jgi:transposase